MPLKSLPWEERLDVFSDDVPHWWCLAKHYCYRKICAHFGKAQLCGKLKGERELRKLTQSMPYYVPGTMSGAGVIKKNIVLNTYVPGTVSGTGATLLLLLLPIVIIMKTTSSTIH